MANKSILTILAFGIPWRIIFNISRFFQAQKGMWGYVYGPALKLTDCIDADLLRGRWQRPSLRRGTRGTKSRKRWEPHLLSILSPPNLSALYPCELIRPGEDMIWSMYWYLGGVLWGGEFPRSSYTILGLVVLLMLGRVQSLEEAGGGGGWLEGRETWKGQRTTFTLLTTDGINGHYSLHVLYCTYNRHRGERKMVNDW